MTTPWTDPITGAKVTLPTPRIVMVALDGKERGFILGEVMPGKYAQIVERWRVANDG